MLKLSADSRGTASVIQTHERPTVDLDHWALMAIAEDTSLATRCIVTLKNRHGTLALSWVNLAEFVRSTDQRQLGDQFVSRIESLRKPYGEDSAFAQAVRKLPKGSALFPATRWRRRELLGFFVKSTPKPVPRNDAADFFHAIVPLAYGDYGLLDGHWATQASNAAHRL